MQQGTVLRIERISPNDGRGLRTVVFLKGCPLRCRWCSTPESQKGEPELYYKQQKCIHCGLCIRTCPQQALSVSQDRLAVVRDKEKCNHCFRCAEVCLMEARGVYGKKMTVEEVMTEIRKESLFYFFSQGGVTLSGGDILLQAEFAAEILRRCKEECLHTMAELDMFGSYEKVRRVVEHLDAYYTDIKLMDEEAHKKWTGVSNASILANIRRSSREFPEKPLHVRLPLIPGVNDSKENIGETIDFCKELPSCRELEILPYHRLGSSTYDYLERGYELAHLEPMDPEEAEERLGGVDRDALPFALKVARR